MSKIIKRIDIDGVTECCAGRKCPAILELSNGDIYLIGEDITDDFISNEDYNECVNTNERVIRIPREIIIKAKDEIM